MSEYIVFSNNGVEKIDLSKVIDGNHVFQDETGSVKTRRVQSIVADGKTYRYAYEGESKPTDYEIKSEIIKLKLASID